MADEKQFSIDDLLFHVQNATESASPDERKTILQRLGSSIKNNVAISNHVVKDAFKKYGIELELDICKRCGSDDVKDKMRRCPVCGALAHTQCFLNPEKCCRRCVKPAVTVTVTTR